MSENLKYKIGDKVWVPSVIPNAEVKKVCPICDGKLVVYLTLGTGEVVKLSCEYCGKTPGLPMGYVIETEFLIEAKCVPVTEIIITNSGVSYSSRNWILHDGETAFATESEALNAAKEHAKKLKLEKEIRMDKIKHNTNKNYSWNAGYHLKEAKRCRELAELHERKAVLCKERSKEERRKGEVK